jgi:hypothetical protein
MESGGAALTGSQPSTTEAVVGGTTGSSTGSQAFVGPKSSKGRPTRFVVDSIDIPVLSSELIASYVSPTAKAKENAAASGSSTSKPARADRKGADGPVTISLMRGEDYRRLYAAKDALLAQLGEQQDKDSKVRP